jgi:hypothetical protein
MSVLAWVGTQSRGLLEFCLLVCYGQTEDEQDVSAEVEWNAAVGCPSARVAYYVKATALGEKGHSNAIFQKKNYQGARPH